MIRDPLTLVPVRYKLPLTFAFLCVVAFGLGGYVVTTTARDALERQIRLRLDDQAANTQLAIDRSLELLGRRVEDFASDGHIRLELERAQDAPLGEEEGARRELIRHLRTNKLPLVPEFVDAQVLGRGGEEVVRAYGRSAGPPTGFSRDGFWYGPLAPPDGDFPYPSFVLSTPLTAIDGTRRLGFLQIVVRADLWADRLRESLAGSPLEGIRLGLSAPNGYRLPLIPDDAGGAAGPQPWTTDAGLDLAFSSTNARTGWTVDLSVDPRALSLPIRTLVSTFIYVGITLVVLVALLLLPSRQFLLKPLAELESAARRITEGDFSARVGYRSNDEVGHLSQAFDVMADAIQERTHRLARVAQDLEYRETEVRFERDRLNTVIHSMEDGLFIIDGQSRVTLANAAAREVLTELGRRHGAAVAGECRRGDRSEGSCLDCLAHFARPAKGCVVTIGASVFDVQATSLNDPEGNEIGRIFVSRDVTERLRQAEQQSHQERMSVLGEVAAVMAHEMNNPLAAISMFSQMLIDGLETASPLRAHAEIVHRNTLSCKRTIRSLLDMATTSAFEKAHFDPRDLVEDVVELLRPVAERGGTVLLVEAGAGAGIAHGDELQIRQALVNLVMNAIQALAETKEGVVRIEIADGTDGVLMRVSDNGPGIPERLRDHVFEPFFTTKPAGEGTGLGLPTSRRIASAQGGRLTLASIEEGTMFELLVPRALAEDQAL